MKHSSFPALRLFILLLILGSAIGLMSYITYAAPLTRRHALPTNSTNPVNASSLAPEASAVLINEVDADTPSSDTAEFIELYGPPNTSLDGLCLVFLNGTNDKSYLTTDLKGHTLDANGFFVVGNAGVANVGLTFANNTLQNGPDAVALYEATSCSTAWPNNTAVTTANLVDAVVYGNNDPDDPGLLTLLNAGQPQVNENGGGDAAAQSNARCPNGTGGARNTNTYLQVPPSPGGANSCSNLTPTPTVPAGATATPTKTPVSTGSPTLQINKQSSAAAISAGQFLTYTIVVNNSGTGAAQEVMIRDTLPAGLTFSGSPTIHDLKGTGTKVVASGAVLTGTVTTLNAGGVVTITARTVVGLNATGQTLNNTAYVYAANVQGAGFATVPTNLVAAATSPVLINELDADTPGSDTAEFVELYGPPHTTLDGLCLVMFNGTSDSSYLALDLDGHTLDANGFFVVGNAAVKNVGLTFANSALQNGPDAVALYVAGACSAVFPNDTPVTTANLVDALVYDTGKTVDTGLLPLLNAGQAQVDETAGGDGANQSSGRCPDGGAGARNTTAYRQGAPSPGTANCASSTATPTATTPAVATPTATVVATPVPTETPAAPGAVRKLYLPIIQR